MSNKSKGRSFPHLPGKPLILRKSRTISSESRLINGLHGVNRARVFLGASSWRGVVGTRADGRGVRKGRIVHGCKLTPVSDIPQWIAIRLSVADDMSGLGSARSVR